MGSSSDFDSYIECHQKVCKKEKNKYDTLFDKEMLNSNSKCKILHKKLQSKYDPAFLREQQMRMNKTLKRNYINHKKYDNDLHKLKNVMDSKLMEDNDFLDALSCKKDLDKAALKRDKCIRKHCGRVPKIKGGGKRTHRKKRRQTKNKRGKKHI